jgi:hypothetical protein
MISEQRVAGSFKSLVQRLERCLLMELRVWQLLVLAAGVGIIWAASLFDWSFVTGRHPFWQFPEGTIGGSRNDMAAVVAGYLYYVQSPWTLPLFYVPELGTPTGVNVVFMDVVPIVAVIGKLIHSLTGATVNLYGGYLFLCFVLPGVMMTLLLIAANIRYGLAVTIAAIFANAMPALLWRWGHIALQSHFLLIGALALYLFYLKKPAQGSVGAVWTGYLMLAYLTNMYLFAMVGIVWLCAVVQRRLNRLATTREALRTAVLTLILVMTVIALSGQFAGGSGPLFSRGYGLYSLNLLSPIVPQESGLFPWRRGVIDATGGYQYEGFNYLGLGLLLGSLLVLPAEAGWLRRNLRRHFSLLVAFAALMVFAMSHRVFAGNRLLFELPLPLYIVWALGIFRSSGRFFWLISYAQVAIVIVLGFRRAQPLIALCLLGAAILQLFDVQLLREQIITSIAAEPRPAELDRREVTNLVARAQHVEVVPSFQCSLDLDERRGELLGANTELMLTTARMNVPTNTALSGRHFGLFGVTLFDVIRAPSRAVETMTERRDAYCEREVEQARSGGRPGDVIILLSDRPRTEEMAAGVACSPLCERSK